MSYAEIDPTILAWVQRHRLALYTQYQDSEVRSVDVIDAKGRKFQIWIDRPKNGKVAIHAWDYRTRRKDWDATSGELRDRLEDALAMVEGWMAG